MPKGKAARNDHSAGHKAAGEPGGGHKPCAAQGPAPERGRTRGLGGQQNQIGQPELIFRQGQKLPLIGAGSRDQIGADQPVKGGRPWGFLRAPGDQSRVPKRAKPKSRRRKMHLPKLRSKQRREQGKPRRFRRAFHRQLKAAIPLKRRPKCPRPRRIPTKHTANRVIGSTARPNHAGPARQKAILATQNRQCRMDQRVASQRRPQTKAGGVAIPTNLAGHPETALIRSINCPAQPQVNRRHCLIEPAPAPHYTCRMGIAADISHDWNAALAALAWQVDLGLSEVVQDTPQDSFALPDAAPWARLAAPAANAPLPKRPAPPAPQSGTDPVQAAIAAARACDTLGALHAALTAFDQCELKRGAKSTVFADGNLAARVLILTEAPGRDEDLQGRPLTGPAGQLLDAMFAAIGLSRSSPDAVTSLYLIPIVPWRPPGNRDPEPGEIALLRPFTERHIALANPDFIVTLGSTPLQALTGTQSARGTWTQAFGKPLLPMTHPATLLRTPAAKREAWADLLSLKARLK